MTACLKDPRETAEEIRLTVARQGWARLALGQETAQQPVQDLERWLTQVSELIGERVPQTRAGTLLVHIRDEGRDYSRYTTRGHQTNSELAFHSDRCDWNLLFYVRTALSGGEIAVVGYEEAAAALRAADKMAYDALFSSFPFDLREERIFSEPVWYCRPILWRNAAGAVRGHYIRRFIADSQRHADCPRLDSRQMAALDRFDARVGALAEYNRFAPRPGDLLVLDNYRVMHARTAFTDGTSSPRLALRTWVAPRDSEALPDSLYPLAGSCLPGVFRGGVGGDADYHTRLGRPCAPQMGGVNDRG